MKVLTFSRQFPKKHPKAGESTFFVEKIVASILNSNNENNCVCVGDGFSHHKIDAISIGGFPEKPHTIRNGFRWKVGEMASLRYWGGVSYRSPQIEFAQVQIKKIWAIKIKADGNFWIRDSKKAFPVKSNMYKQGLFMRIARNDGFDNMQDLKDWIDCHPKKKKGKYIFQGQIVCWSGKIKY